MVILLNDEWDLEIVILREMYFQDSALSLKRTLQIRIRDFKNSNTNINDKHVAKTMMQVGCKNESCLLCYNIIIVISNK